MKWDVWFQQWIGEPSGRPDGCRPQRLVRTNKRVHVRRCDDFQEAADCCVALQQIDELYPYMAMGYAPEMTMAEAPT
jgi:hypothetical protein